MENNSSKGNILQLNEREFRAQLRRAKRTPEQRARRRRFLRAQTGIASKGAQPNGK